MAIKVIKRGTPPEEKVFRGTCGNCRSILEWSRKDALTYTSATQRDSEFSTIKCLVCNHNSVVGY